MSVVFTWEPTDFDTLVANCPHEPVTPYILRYMPREGRILEAGCGSGRFVYYLKQLGYDIRGIELGTSTVATLNACFPELDIQVGDVRELPWPAESLDGIISLGVIEHVIQGIAGPLREMYRVLKPGALAIVIVPSFNPIRRMKRRLGLLHLRAGILAAKRLGPVRKAFGKPPLSRVDDSDPRPLKNVHRWPVAGPFFEYRFTRNEFESAIANAGFTIVESVPTSQIDGLYHEFGRPFVRYRNHAFYPNLIGQWLNRALSRVPFLHNHMHLCVVRKPIAAEEGTAKLPSRPTI